MLATRANVEAEPRASAIGRTAAEDKDPVPPDVQANMAAAGAQDSFCAGASCARHQARY
jgi:hypothetical protein